MPAVTAPRPAVALAMLGFAVACATPPPPPALPPPPPPPPELDTATICRVVVEAEDAAARGNLVAFRHEAERRGADRHAVFAKHLALATPEERFRAFHDELTERPGSPVGPLGECLVYASWSRMGPQAAKACDIAAAALGPQRVLADIGRSQSALLHDGDAARALALADAGLVAAPGCDAFVVARARARAATSDPATARDAWRDAVAALPGSFRCLTEAALAEERADASPAGRAAAAALFERALAVAPDHADTLRRFAAATAGVDDVRALTAYAAAVKAGARDYPTLLAAARLATALASSDDDVSRAIDFASRASEASREDPEPRRLLVQMLARQGAWDDVIVAGNALLDLEGDDAAAHHALARAALAKGDVAGAVRHYDAANRSLASLDAAAQTAVTTGLQALLTRLLVDPAKAPKGGANVVASAIQRQLQTLWTDRVKRKAVTKGGDLVVVAETDATGRVVAVDIKSDGVNDPDLAGAAVAWLSRAAITGGARRYTLEFAVR
jgi:tetratricopeptide (TPR) repeat protein